MADVELSIGARLDGIDASIKAIKDLANEAAKAAKGTEEQFKKTNSTLSTFKDGIGKAALAFTAINEGIDIIKQIGAAFAEPIKAAIEQEDAINSLNIALASNGNYTKEASDQMQKFASTIESTTKFSEEQTLAAAALLEQITGLDKDGLQKATQSAINFASAFHKDLTTAAEAVGKAAEGNTTAFQKLGIEIKKGATDSETFSNTLDALAKFQNAATLEVKTFSGSLINLQNKFEDNLKTVGKAIIQNDELNQTIQDASKFIEDNAGTVQTLADIFAKGLSLAIKGAEIAFTSLKDASSAFYTVFSTVKDVVVSVASAIADIPGKIKSFLGLDFSNLDKLNPETGKRFVASFDQLDETTKSMDDLVESIGGINEGLTKTSKSKVGDELDKQFQLISDAVNKTKQGLGVEIPEALKKLQDKFKNAGLDRVQNFEQERDEMLKTIQKFEDQDVKLHAAAEELKGKVVIDFEKKIQDEKTKIQQEQRDKEVKAIEEQKKRIADLLSGNIADIIAQIQLNPKLSTLDLSALGGNILTQISKGAEGAASVISSTLGAAANTFLPGIGPVVTQIASVFSQGAEAVKKFTTEFVNGIKDTIVNIIEAVPVFITTLIEAVPDLVQALVDELPVLITELANSIGPIIEAIVEAVPEIITALVEAIPSVVTALIESIPTIIQALISHLPEFFLSMISFIPSVIQALIDGIPKIIDTIVTQVPLIINKLIDGAINFVETIIQKVPEIIFAIIDKIPVLIDTLVDGAVKMVTTLIDKVPEIIDRLVTDIPKIINELVAKIPEVINKLVEKAPDIISKLVEKAPDLAIAFNKALIKEAPKVITEMIKQIPTMAVEMAKGFVQAIKDALGGVVSGVGDIFSGIGSLFGFADGGQISGKVPPGFANDSFRTNLTSGELVVDRTDTNRLSQFLDQQQQGQGINDRLDQLISVSQSNGGQPLTINLKIGEKDLADVILNLNRQGFRTA